MTDGVNKNLVFRSIIAIALFVSLLMGLSNGWYQVVFELVWGWIAFLTRTLPSVSIRWDGVLIFLVGSLIFGVLLHFTLSWMMQAMLTEQDKPASSRWRLKWTVLIVLTIELAFVAGTAMIGVTHQTAWLMQSEEPAFGIRYSGYYGKVQNDLRMIALETHNFESSYERFPHDTKHHSWITEIMPFGVFGLQVDEIDFAQPWDSEQNAEKFKSPHPSFLNSNLTTDSFYDQQGFALSHFAGNEKLLGAYKKRALADLKSQSNTILVGEINTNFLPWGSPGNVRNVDAPFNSPSGFGEVERGRITTALADGSVKIFNTDVDSEVFRSFAGSFTDEDTEQD